MRSLGEIVALMRQAGLKVTPQRLGVVEYFRNGQCHPSVDEIYEELRNKFPTISRATVYSTLELLRNMGEIQQLTIIREKAHYDPDHIPHHHFLCQKCGTISNVNISCPVVQRGCVQGHRIQDMQAYFYGICSRCSERSTASREAGAER